MTFRADDDGGREAEASSAKSLSRASRCIRSGMASTRTAGAYVRKADGSWALREEPSPHAHVLPQGPTNLDDDVQPAQMLHALSEVCGVG